MTRIALWELWKPVKDLQQPLKTELKKCHTQMIGKLWDTILASVALPPQCGWEEGDNLPVPSLRKKGKKLMCLQSSNLFVTAWGTALCTACIGPQMEAKKDSNGYCENRRGTINWQMPEFKTVSIEWWHYSNRRKFQRIHTQTQMLLELTNLVKSQCIRLHTKITSVPTY